MFVLPSAFGADTDVEAFLIYFLMPVPYFAAYLALMSAQTSIE